MSKVVVREATECDDQRIGQILVEGYLTTYAKKMPEVVLPPERIADLKNVSERRKVATVLVCIVDDKIVGTLTLFKPNAAGSEAWLPNAADLRYLVFDPEYHGKGLSKYLLDRAEDISRNEWKTDAICLHTRRGAHGVATLYHRRGFVRDPRGDLVLPTVTLDGHIFEFKDSD